jgi:prepilin-type N-terminal cleavage/methylation domain-containing protein
MYKGFTLLELLMSVAVLSLLAIFIIPVSQSLQNRNNLDAATQTIVLAIRHAQLQAIGGKSDDSWGIHLSEGIVTIFRGGSYGDHPSDNDEQSFTPTISPSGTTEFVFEKITGTLGEAGEITLTGPSGDERTITVNEKGAIFY